MVTTIQRRIIWIVSAICFLGILLFAATTPTRQSSAATFTPPTYLRTFGQTDLDNYRVVRFTAPADRLLIKIWATSSDFSYSSLGIADSGLPAGFATCFDGGTNC